MPPPIGMATMVAMRMASASEPAIHRPMASSSTSQPKNAAQPPISVLQTINRINDIAVPHTVSASQFTVTRTWTQACGRRDQMESMAHRPRLLITLGDVAGIGPEIVAKAWGELQAICEPVVVGDIG